MNNRNQCKRHRPFLRRRCAGAYGARSGTRRGTCQLRQHGISGGVKLLKFLCGKLRAAFVGSPVADRADEGELFAHSGRKSGNGFGFFAQTAAGSAEFGETALDFAGADDDASGLKQTGFIR